MTTPRTISVLMPILNGARYLERVLRALAEQRSGCPWDFLALDCGSTDGTLELFAKWAARFPVPLVVKGIQREEFNHGCTRNMLAALSSGELLVFLTDDAIPIGTDWLNHLAANFCDDRVAAAYCRNITRPEADILVRLQNESDPTYRQERFVATRPEESIYARWSPVARRQLYNYCDSASAMRRSLWERHPYPRCAFGEDVLQARAFIEAGYQVVFDEKASVEHSHDYTPEELLKRARLDGEFQAEWLGLVPIPTRKSAERMARKATRKDGIALYRSGLRGRALLRKLAEASSLRQSYFTGLFEGSRSRRRRALTHLLPDKQLELVWVMGSAASLQVRSRLQSLVPILGELGCRVRMLSQNEALAELEAATGLGAASLVHVHSPGQDALGLLQAIRRRAVPWLVHFHEAAEAVAGNEVLYVCRQAELALASTREVYTLLCRQGGFRRGELVLIELRESRGGAAREPAWTARELAFRYRSVAARRGEQAAVFVHNVELERSSPLRGDVQVLESGVVLLGPGPASLGLQLAALQDGRWELDLESGTLGLPQQEQLLGSLEWNGRKVHFGATPAAQPNQSIQLTLRVEHAGGPVRMVIENAAKSGRSAWLRLERIQLQRNPEQKRRPTEVFQSWAARLAEFVDVPVRVGE